jgi:hypothetical protein
MLYWKGDVTAYRRAVDSVRTRGDTLDRDWGKRRYAELVLLDGRLNEFTRLWDQLEERNLNNAEHRLDRALDIPAFARLELLEGSKQGVRELEIAIAGAQKAIPAGEWPYFAIIDFFSLAQEAQQARQWLNRYDAEAKDTFRLRVERPGRLRVGAEVLIAEGKALEAVADLRRSEQLPDGPLRNCMACLPTYLAFAFDEAGMPDSAIFYMEEALTVFDPNRMSDVRDPVLIPFFNRRLGELYEAKGDRVKAAKHYRVVLDVWKNAEPELQVIVNDLRERVRRLSDNERPPGR